MRKELSIETRAKIVALRQAKFPFPQNCKQLRLANPNTTGSFYSTYCKIGSLESKKRIGRIGKKTKESEERFIVGKAKKNPFAICKQLQCEFNSFSKKTTVSVKTIRRILRRRKLIGRAAAKKILLRQKSRVERLNKQESRRFGNLKRYSSEKQYCF